jgi:hypothetical protein
LEAIALSVADVVGCMEQDAGMPLTTLRVDGGASTNDLLLQRQADVLGIAVERPVVRETTALVRVQIDVVHVEGSGLERAHLGTGPVRLVAAHGIRVAHRVHLAGNWRDPCPLLPNLLAGYALYDLTRA